MSVRPLSAALTVAMTVGVLAPSRALAQSATSTWSCFEATTGAQVGAVNDIGSVGNVTTPATTVPAGSPTAPSSADGGPLSGGSSGGGEGMLAMIVIAAAALPVVIYAVDSPAEESQLKRYHCPSFNLRATTGGMSLPSNPNAFTALEGGRATFGMDWFGADFGYETTFTRGAFTSIDAHLQLRPPPKHHVEGALAVGVRRVVFGGAENDGIEVSLPHRYLLARVLNRPFAIEVDPGVMFGLRGIDYRLDAGVAIPIAVMDLRLGARVFSFDTHVRAGAYLGFDFGS